MRSPRSIQAGVISRLKVMADINIAERRVPQDGRISMKVGGRGIDLRVATLPTVYGEKVVMRILDKGQAVLRLEELGFLPERSRRVRDGLPQAVRHDPRDRPDRIREVDDALRDAQHAERRPTATSSRSRTRSSTGCPGSTRCRSTRRPGSRSRSALRSILRADPDVVLVGEIRDRETAIIAIEAALTGHLVLSTLHTNDAASTPLRLVEMGVEPFLVTQRARLRRRAAARPPALRQVQGAVPADRGRARRASGWPTEELDGGRLADAVPRRSAAPRAGETGYRGRFALHEVMLVSEEIERLDHRAALDRGHPEDRRHAGDDHACGSDGLRKAAVGLTSLEEIFRVVAVSRRVHGSQGFRPRGSPADNSED